MGIRIKGLWLIGIAAITLGYVGMFSLAEVKEEGYYQSTTSTVQSTNRLTPVRSTINVTDSDVKRDVKTPQPKTQQTKGRTEWDSTLNSTNDLLVKTYTASGFISKLYYDQVSCVGWLSVSRESLPSCKDYVTDQHFSNDPPIFNWIKTFFGPEHLRIQLRGPEIVMGNTTFHLDEVSIQGRKQPPCSYISHFVLGRVGTYSLWAEHLYEKYGAVAETVEKTWYPILGTDLTEHTELVCKKDMVQPGHSCGVSQSLEWGRWVDAGSDRSNFQKEYPGYWLHYKHEAKVNKHTPDILGRINFERSYKWEPYSCTHTKYPKEMILEILRNRRITLFGDSHMRMTFYGLLQRMNINFPHNKVWRGDRTDRIASHNISISYVAAYFLNMSRPTARDMLSNGDIIVAGVGQHHASSCWSIRKHSEVVNEAMSTFDAHPKLKIIWLGVPAHPLNKHIRSHQHRVDCRNNLRHRYDN